MVMREVGERMEGREVNLAKVALLEGRGPLHKLWRKEEGGS